MSGAATRKGDEPSIAVEIQRHRASDIPVFNLPSSQSGQISFVGTNGGVTPKREEIYAFHNIRATRISREEHATPHVNEHLISLVDTNTAL